MAKINLEQRKANFLTTHKAIAQAAYAGSESSKLTLTQLAKAANFTFATGVTDFFRKAWDRVKNSK